MTDMPNTSQSQQWFERSSKVIPGGVNSPVRAFGSVGGQARVIERGAGSRLWDVDGNELDFMATGWFARCMQHEYDHLNGFLYVDRLGDRWKKKARKAVKAEGWGVPGHTWLPGEGPDPFGHDDPDVDEE